MIDLGRVIRVSAAFVLGFGAMIWSGAAGLDQLGSPRTRLLAELNALRVAGDLAPLTASPALGRAARWELQRLAGEPAGTPPSPPGILERVARERGWRGAAAPRVLALRAADAELPCSAHAGATWSESPGGRHVLLDIRARHAALALATDARGASLCVLVVG